MKPANLLIGQIVVALAIALGGVWSATQWTAWQLGYQQALGAPLYSAHYFRIYAPWQIFAWWFFYSTYAPNIFNKAAMMAGTGVALAAVASLGSHLLYGGERPEVTTFGSARWATHREIKRSGLFGHRGVFLGRLGNEYLRHDGPEHVLAFAPTRSGKGVGLVVPTLLSWTGSVIVHDIKGENWDLTAGWRAKFSHCVLFNPTDDRSARFNPLMEVRKGPYEVRDAQNIADILVDPEGMLERRNHWQTTSHSFLVGVILHVLYAEPLKTLEGVAIFLTDPKRDFADTLQVMLTANHLGTADSPRVHPVVASAARELQDKSPNERSGILSTATSFLSLYHDPVVSRVTSSCDWRIADLVDGVSPVSLFLVVPPSDISRTKPLIRLMLNQIGRRLTEQHGQAGHKRKPHPLLLMLDEFPALGRLDFFESSLAFMAGYGIRAYLIAQSLNQIEKAYGPYNSILDNCHVRIAFASNDERTARRISDALGAATEQRLQRNYAGHRLAPWLTHMTVGRQQTARPLLTPGEVMQLAPSDELILISGLPPIRAEKLRYYDDANFKSRRLSPPELSLTEFRDAPKLREADWDTSLFHPILEQATPALPEQASTRGRPKTQPKTKPKSERTAEPLTERKGARTSQDLPLQAMSLKETGASKGRQATRAQKPKASEAFCDEQSDNPDVKQKAQIWAALQDL